MRSVLVLPNSIFGRLRLVLITVFVVGALGALLAAWDFSVTAATDAYDRLLISSATQISEAIAVDQHGLSVLPPDSAFETLGQSEGDRFYYAVRGPDGSLLTGDPRLRPATGSLRDGPPTFGYIKADGDRMRTITIFRLIASPTGSGWCSVVVAQSLHARSRLVNRLMLRIGAVILFVGALGFLASMGAVRRALRPFDRIGSALAARRSQDTGPLEVDSPRETQALVETINAAFQRLDERLNKLQNFAGVAAHQIRTPLAALGAQAELLLSDKTRQARSTRVERIRTHVSTLSRLTNQLLGQALVSYRADRIPHERVELTELIQRVLRDAIPESLDRDLAVEFEPPQSSVHVWGDPVTLREALANLVGNAVTHGAASRLRVQIQMDQESARVLIADDGPGIPSSLWNDALRPFSISRTQRAGAGLGLSIAAEVAQAHGGKLDFGHSADGLFQIALSLPCARAGERA
jgi:two-component system sensor histidine kinase TctE